LEGILEGIFKHIKRDSLRVPGTALNRIGGASLSCRICGANLTLFTTISPGFITLHRVAHYMCLVMIQICNLSLRASIFANNSIGWSCRTRARRIKAKAAAVVCLEGNKARSMIQLAKLCAIFVQENTTWAMSIGGFLVDF
jgi:hypothetical protein